MTSAFFDAGDFQRLDRERTLIEQSDRVPIEPDVSPADEIDEEADSMLARFMAALKRSL